MQPRWAKSFFSKPGSRTHTSVTLALSPRMERALNEDYDQLQNPSLLTRKHKAVTVSPKKRHPHPKTRNSKPNHKRSLDSNQNSVRAHQKQRGSLGNITVHIFVRRLFYMYWRAAHQKQKRKEKKQRKKDMASNRITLEQHHCLVSVSSTHLLSAGIKAGGSITMAGSRRHGEDSWVRGGFGASTTQYNK